ncbi:recombinase RecA [Alteromonas lipotrueiana]|uniref:recombinase RecA n=1 Tax=Alteromonas lipotrueiana TaxID=2803815 RepID=UPI001C43D48A|nr:recombinase RecA [Alteromonas lipotrueiana]
MTQSTSSLQQHPAIWRASDSLKHTEIARLNTGYDALNTILSGGFPAAGLTRIRSLLGIGEISALKLLISHNPLQKLLVFINPPGKIHKSWLASLGQTSNTVHVVYCATPEQTLWTAEQCIKSEACYLVLMWHQAIEPKQARRLQVAAAQHDTLCLLYETFSHQYNALPVALDIELQPAGNGLRITVHKNIGSWPGQSTQITFKHTPDNQAIYRAMNNTVALQALSAQVG